MSHARSAAVLLSIAALTANVAASAAPAPGPDRPSVAATPKCISLKTWTRYIAGGYDQMVTITSTCPSEAKCEVSTSTNPDKISVSVEKDESVDVRTWSNAPGYEFSATVDCTGGT